MILNVTLRIGLCAIPLALIVISVLVCILILLLMLSRMRQNLTKVSTFLIVNTYLSMLFTNMMLTIIFVFVLYGIIEPSVLQKSSFCTIRAYLMYSAFCVFYYSFLLQAFYRLFRVVFHKYKLFQSRRFFIAAIAVQWLLSFALSLPNFLLNDYTRLPYRYRCWIAIENVRGLSIAFLVVYIIPMSMIVVINAKIIRFVRFNSNIHQRRKKSNARDAIVMKRILMILSVNIGIGIPSAVLLLIYIFTSFLPEYAYEIQDFSLSIGFCTATICFTWVTPEIRKMLKENFLQIYPLESAINHRTVEAQNRTETVDES